MPDFDIDFCQDRRDEVIQYVQQKYGSDRVAQIITFGKLQARAVLRDVGRVLQMPYGQVDKICKLVPNNPANPVTLAEAIAGEPELQFQRDNDPTVGRLIDIALKLEGLYRHASTHAAGVVIGDRPLDELIPLYRDPRSDMPVTQFNMKFVEQAGLVKFDFLGLKTLTVLNKAAEFVRESQPDFDLDTLPLDDAEAYRVMARGDTVGVFQLESSGMRDALRKLKPDRFEDVIAMVALYRPGPMENIPSYIKRKYGDEEPRLPLSQPGADPEGDLRDHDLPGAGHADRPGAGRLQPGRRRPAAPRHGQEDRGRDGRPARDVRRGRGRQGRGQGAGLGDLRPGRQVRRLRLQQVPRRRLRAGRLSDRLHEGQPPGRVPGGLDDLRHDQHRQARRLPPGAGPSGHQAAAAGRQPLGAGLRRGAPGGTGGGQGHPLRPGGAEERRTRAP